MLDDRLVLFERTMIQQAAMYHKYAVLSFAVVAQAQQYEHSNINVSQPQDNAPLDLSLASYSLTGYNGVSSTLTHSFFPTDCGANLSVHYTDPDVWADATGTAKKPILILTHGYPESSYIWRDVVPTLSQRVPVFVPDQPGYGLSTACCNVTGCFYDKRTYAQSIMQAVRAAYGDSVVIYGGHDRGARTMVNATSTTVELLDLLTVGAFSASSGGR